MIIKAFVSESLLTRRNAAGCSASAPCTEYSTKCRRANGGARKEYKISQESKRSNI